MQLKPLIPLPDQLEERFALFKQMRESNPVYFDEETRSWHVFRYEDVSRVLTDIEHFSSSIRFGPGNADPLMLFMDPPLHRKIRSLVSQAFTPRTVAQLAPRIKEIVQEELDRVRDQGKMDVIWDLAYPLPTTVIAELLGIALDQRANFKKWTDAMMKSSMGDLVGQNGQYDPEQNNEVHTQGIAANDQLQAFLLKLIEERRRQPGQDLVSLLLASELDGESLTMEQVLSMCNLLLVGGHETTTHLLGNAIYCFDQHPGTIERLIHETELMPGAIEEVLRYLPVSWYAYRITKKDVTLGGQHIPAGRAICVWMASANRDAAQFSNPDQFDIQRASGRHFGFGYGIHFCLGAPLARLEASIALPLMLEQLPNLRRIRREPLEGFGSEVVFGMKSLPISFTPA